jgi:UDP-N-acetylmuramyl tripeptide synthase
MAQHRYSTDTVHPPTGPPATTPPGAGLAADDPAGRTQVILVQQRTRPVPATAPGLPVRARLAVTAGWATSRACRMLRRGWAARAGGRIALRVDPRLTGRLATGLNIALVSGTNGKSTTARLLTEALRGLGPVAATRTAAGTEQNVVATLTRQPNATMAVLEVDEVALAHLARATQPAVIVLLNLSREYAPGRGLATVLATWRELFDTLDWPCTVLANLDDPLVAWAAANAPRLVGVAGGLLWPSDALLCPDCGVRLLWSGPRWCCDQCGATRPEPAWLVTDDELVVGPEVTAPLRVAVPGRAGWSDALHAVAAAHLLGTPVRDATRAVAAVAEVDGRYAQYPVGDHTVHLYLADNPAGWREIIEVAGHAEAPIVFALDAAGVADATVLWDAPGELLHGVPVTAAGSRRFDVATWLEVCGVEVAGVVSDPLGALPDLPPGPVVLAANRPAFVGLRARLRSRA